MKRKTSKLADQASRPSGCMGTAESIITEKKQDRDKVGIRADKPVLHKGIRAIVTYHTTAND